MLPRASFSFVLTLLLAMPTMGEPLKPTKVDLSPARWSPGELDAAWAIDATFFKPPSLATGKHAMVATTSYGGVSLRAGAMALEQGGSAVDAALTIALTQTALNLGSWTSFAGMLGMVIYDAESGEVFSLEGGWNTVKNERDPQSIPPRGSGGEIGRQILVPGFMAAVQAAHDRFGALPFAELFAPAIHFASEGIELTPIHGFFLKAYGETVTRHPQAREIFLRPDGTPYEAGDLFRQPQLAATLQAVAKNGADAMYRGAWAEQLVALVRQQGGKMTLGDLKAYRPIWRPPARGGFGDIELYGLGLPARGGIDSVEAFRLLELAGIDRRVHYADDPEALYRVIQILRLPYLLIQETAPAAFWHELFGERDLSPWARLDPAATAAIWQRLAAPDWQPRLRRALELLPPTPPPGGHSDGIVAIDARGNVVAMLHSINTPPWGSGLFVGGVSLADFGSNRIVANTPPGQTIPRTGQPLIALREGKPLVASASIGQGVHTQAVQNVLNLVLYDLDPLQSIEKSQVLGAVLQPGPDGRRPIYRERVYADAFDPKILAQVEARGQEIVRIDRDDRQGLGYWVGLKIDPKSGLIQASSSGPSGHASGF